AGLLDAGAAPLGLEADSADGIIDELARIDGDGVLSIAAALDGIDDRHELSGGHANAAQCVSRGGGQFAEYAVVEQLLIAEDGGDGRAELVAENCVPFGMAVHD